MSYEFKLPDLGEGITSGEIKKWNVKKGDSIKEDDPIAEVETDKAVVEIPSPATGSIADLRFKEGDAVPVGSVIAVIQEAGEAVKAPAAMKAPAVQEKAEGKATAAVTKKPESTPSAAPGETAGKVPVLAPPSTRMLAKQLGVAIESVKGTGPGGRITDEDVKAAAGKPQPKPEGEAAAKVPAPVVPTPVVSTVKPGGLEERIPVRGTRRTISENLLKSLQHTAQVTIFDDADITKLSELRDQVNGMMTDGIKVSYLAFIVKAVTTALRDHPLLNASVDEGMGEIVQKKYYHIGIAIDTPRGLLVAPVKDSDRKTIVQISKEIKELVELANTGKITVEQLRGSTFTIANIGSIGGLYSTPIINYPESAILEMQQIREMPRVCNGSLCVRKVMNLCLTIDHRIIDGAEGQRFVNQLKKYLEDPQLLLVSIV